MVEVVLTRRNLFGPLHLVPKEQFHIGPPSFRSTVGAYHAGVHEEPAYSVVPQLYPSGLLAAPEFEIAERNNFQPIRDFSVFKAREAALGRGARNTAY